MTQSPADDPIESVDFDALFAWMQVQGLGVGPIEDVRLLGGGSQNILVRFRRGDEGFVLRRPPLVLRANSNETMRREAKILSALAGSNVPHPALISASPDESVLGVAFYLMQPVDGFNPTVGLPPLHTGSAALRHRIGLSMVEAIAALGRLDYRAAGLEGFGKVDNFLERQVGRWKSQLASYSESTTWPGPQGLPDVERIGQWLDAHRPVTTRPGLIHGDFHLANVMVRHDSGELAAVIDWELCTLGDPLLDLGWLLATWPEGDIPLPTDVSAEPWTGFACRQELVAHYAACSDLDVSAIDWYEVLACFKLAIILEGTYARSCAGQAPKETGERLHRHAVDKLERALRRIA